MPRPKWWMRHTNITLREYMCNHCKYFHSNRWIGQGLGWNFYGGIGRQVHKCSWQKKRKFLLTSISVRGPVANAPATREFVWDTNSLQAHIFDAPKVCLWWEFIVCRSYSYRARHIRIWSTRIVSVPRCVLEEWVSIILCSKSYVLCNVVQSVWPSVWSIRNPIIAMTNKSSLS